MTRAEIIDLIREQTLVEADDYPQDKLANVVNLGVRDIASRAEWPWLNSTVTDTTVSGAITFPTDLVRLRNVVVDGELLTETTPEQAWLDYDTDTTSTTPERYTIVNRTLTIYPTPVDGTSVNVSYYKEVDLLGDSSSVPEWAEQFHPVLVSYGLWRVHEREEDYNRAAAHQGEFEFTLERMRRWYRDTGKDSILTLGESTVNPSHKQGNLSHVLGI